MSKWKTILVGVDGSPGSRTALRWAAAEAADHGADLVVLTVWDRPLLPPMGSGEVPASPVPDPGQTATEDLVKVIKEELGEDPPVLVQPRAKLTVSGEVCGTGRVKIQQRKKGSWRRIGRARADRGGGREHGAWL